MTTQITKTKEIHIGMPAMGVYGELLKEAVMNVLKRVGINNVKIHLAPPITRKTINRGAQHMDENMCLPAKILLGSILDLYESGNEVIVDLNHG